MSARRGAASLLVLVLAGCATARADFQEPIAPALTALREGGYAVASGALYAIWEQCPGGATGERALLLALAAALDPRNPAADPTGAAELATSYLRVRDDASWGVPITEVFYLLALELGAQPGSEEEDGDVSRNGDADAESDEVEPASEKSGDGIGASLGPDACPPLDDSAPRERQPPSLTGPPIAERAAALDRERSELLRRVRELERLVASQKGELEQLVASHKEELERIRRTLNHVR